jgi:hypothetical protein
LHTKYPTNFRASLRSVRLLSGEKGITIGKNENFEFPLWEIKLENGKILTEARYRFDVLTEPEVSSDPGNSDSPPTVPEERNFKDVGKHKVFHLKDEKYDFF